MKPEPSGATEGLDHRSDLDTVIAQLWTEELGRRTLGVHETFESLGGDTEIARRLHARLTSEIQVDLPPDAIDPHQTVARLSDEVATARFHAAKHPTLVALRPDGDLAPLFCIAGGGGYAFNFLALTKALSPRRPVYGLHARGLESRSRARWTVEGHAQHHLKTIREVQPGGPYLLLGFSFGGLVAYEIAQQLRAAGEQVIHLGLLDTPVPGFATPADDRSTVRGRLAIAARTVLQYRRIDVVKSFLLPAVGLVRFPGHHQQSMHFLWSAITVNLYQIEPYQGSATVYLADSGPRATAADWARLLGPAGTQVAVSGSHNGIMLPPNVATVAGDLEQRIRAAEQEASGPAWAPEPESPDAPPAEPITGSGQSRRAG